MNKKEVVSASSQLGATLTLMKERTARLKEEAARLPVVKYDERGRRYEGGEFLVFTSGMYSDYYLHELVRVIKPFLVDDYLEVIPADLKAAREHLSSVRLKDEGLVEPIEYEEIWQDQ